MDDDGPDVFDRTVDWAVAQGIETATFHIMTPYPGTALYARMAGQGRMLHQGWDRYDTRQVVFRPKRLTADQLEAGYWRAYRDFYRWPAIWRGASTKERVPDRLRHLAYAGGWKKFEPLWDLAIRSRQVLRGLPLLEATLASFGGRRPGQAPGQAPGQTPSLRSRLSRRTDSAPMSASCSSADVITTAVSAGSVAPSERSPT